MTTTEKETRRSALACVLSDEKVIDAARRLIDGERRLRRAYTLPRTTGNAQDLTREFFFARNDIKEAGEALAEAAHRITRQIVQAEPVEVTV